MITYVVVGLTALATSGLTFFTGFGLGTLLLPAFTLFFPPSVAITLTAIVHFFNGVFKIMLVGRHVHWRTVLRFGLPAMLAAFAGAKVMLWLTDLRPLTSYTLMGRELFISPVKVALALLMLVFASAEASKRVNQIRIAPEWMPLGGIISGFFGGLSGHQGAFRSPFLMRLGLEPPAFIATGSMIALFIDVTRLATYFSGDALEHARSSLPLVLTATLAAFTGAFIGNRYLHKVTLRSLQLAVAGLLAALALGLLAGII